MKSKKIIIIMTYVVVVIFIIDDDVFVNGMTAAEKSEMKEKVVEMFKHAYQSYMNNAYPADELMPLSCKGRYRGTEPSRGDIDDSLGNFTLTLIDTLDTLVVMGELEEFENAVRLVIQNTKFDTDVIVSVFETNIRVLGGLLGGHVLASYLKKKKKTMEWYNDELLNMAKDVGYRLLPAFNTSTGIPYPRINLKHGVSVDLRDRNKDTCTACAGTMILEFAALSRLTGEEIFEEKAHKAMDYLWKQRHRASDLVGTVINVHNGDWIRRESGVGAGIDSYYEYVLKAYILLGDDIYLNRFNKHYSAVMKYISQGPMLLDVHMHKPHSASRNFMDSLLAFWPGLQVLKGDIRPAIETHEMLYQIIQKHNFLPEAFTTDFRVHWGHHPLRPEFVESTYFLYKATGDSHYLRVGRQVIENMNALARVPCGFAGIKDVSTGGHEDQMDSYVFAETFKYLYLLFSEKSDVVFNIDDYLFTTEAHLLPLSLSVFNASAKLPKIRREVYNEYQENEDEEYYEANMQTSYTEELHHSTCPNFQQLFKNAKHYAYDLRTEMQGMVEKLSPPTRSNSKSRLRAIDFIAGNKAQLEILHSMGIRIATMADGRVQLLHSATEAQSPEDAEEGMRFMQEMIQLSQQQQNEPQQEPATVQFISHPYYGSVHFLAGTAQFGYNLKKNPPVQGHLAITEPYNACTEVTNPDDIVAKIAVIERGSCMFIDKARNIQKVGAIGVLVIDHTEGSTSQNQPLFAMSGDGTQDVTIPLVFLYHKEGQQVLGALKAANYDLQVLLTSKPKSTEDFSPSKNTCETNTEDLDILQAKQAQGPSKDHMSESDQSDTSKSDQLSTANEQSDDVLIKQKEKPVKVFQNLQSLQAIPEDKKHYRILASGDGVEIEVGAKTSQYFRAGMNLNRMGGLSDKFIKMIPGPDGWNQILFNFPDLWNKEPQTKPELNQIYVEIVHILQTKTNFYKLENQADYLMAIARLLESAYFGTGKVDPKAQKMFHKLSNELEIMEENEDDQSESSKVLQPDQSAKVSESDLSQSSESSHSDQSETVLQTGEGSQEITIEATHNEQTLTLVVDEGKFEHYASSQDLNEQSEEIKNIQKETSDQVMYKEDQAAEGLETNIEQINTFQGKQDISSINSDRDTENIEIQNNMQQTKLNSEQSTSEQVDVNNNKQNPESAVFPDTDSKSEKISTDKSQSIEQNNKPHRTNDEL